MHRYVINTAKDALIINFRFKLLLDGTLLIITKFDRIK